MSFRSRRTAVSVACCVAVADVVLLWPRAASADAPVATGSWQLLRQSTPLGVTPSTRTPGDDSLPVQNSPAGVLAFSALRYTAGGATGGLLTLSLAGPSPADAPRVDLCPTTARWADGADQPWGSRPSYDCTHPIEGAGNPSQVTWEVGPDLIRSGALDVALVPDPGDRTPFAVTFAAPDAGSFEPIEGATAKPVPAGTGAADSGSPTSTSPTRRSGETPTDIPALGSTSTSPDDPGQPPAVAPTGTSASSAQPVAARGPASRTLGAAALAGFALLLLLRSFVTVGSKGRTPRSLILRPPGEA